MSILKYFGGLFLLGVSVAQANVPVPANGGYLGIDYIQMLGANGTTGCFSQGCGGEFSGTITVAGQGPSGLAGAITTNFWCVDFQEDFSYGAAGYADVVPLLPVTGSAPGSVTGNANVRYSNVGTGSNPSWTTDLSSPLGSFDTAQDRYNLAAYLVSQYPGVSGNLANPQIVDNANASEIQQAIWVIMSNNSGGTGAQFTINGSGNSVDTYFNDSSDVQSLILGAETNYRSTAGQWAIVSWDADPASGALTGANHQTFLVEMSGVPEPSFYGLLALGMGGMYVAVRRRKNA